MPDFAKTDVAGRTLVITCGALAREVMEIKRLNRLDHIEITCLPAHWHNHPQKIAPGVRAKIRAGKRKGYTQILCLYGDCGSGGMLDAVLAEEGVARIEGAHCYAFYAGIAEFEAMHAAEIGTFYLTDYLVRHFDRLIIKGLGLDRFPQLRDTYFGHYTRLLYLAQTEDLALREKAARCARTLGLPLEIKQTGYGLMTPFLRPDMHQQSTSLQPEIFHGQPDHPLLARNPDAGDRARRADQRQARTLKALHRGGGHGGHAFGRA